MLQAYEHILPPDAIPAYFIYFETDPERIDINIHPTKTEIKFEDEVAIWQILLAVVRESIGKHNLIPSLDFNKDGVIDIPVLRSDTEIRHPKENFNPAFNPFESQKRDNYSSAREIPGQQRSNLSNWEKIYGIIPGELSREEQHTTGIQTTETPENKRFLQIKNRYIITSVKSGLLIIDQKRAHERILYENYLHLESSSEFIAQQSLFPETIELNPSEYVTLIDILDEVNLLGFDIRDLGNNSVIIYGIPVSAKNSVLKSMIDEMLEIYNSFQGDLKIKAKERIARSVAHASVIPYGKVLEQEEMRELVDQLFGCSIPNYSPLGKPVFQIISIEEIDKILK